MPDRETIELDGDDQAFIAASLAMVCANHPDKDARERAARLYKWLEGTAVIKLYAWLHKAPVWADQQ